MKRHHDHSNSYKGKHLIGAGLQGRGLVHYHHEEKHGGRQGSGEGAESSTLGSAGSKKREIVIFDNCEGSNKNDLHRLLI